MITHDSALALLRDEHDNIAKLLLALESHLALVEMGEDFDAGLMLDEVDYLLDYLGRFHCVREDLVVRALRAREPKASARLGTLSEQHDAIQSDGAELRRRLDHVTRGELLDRREVVRLGFAFSTDLRRSMSLEEATLTSAVGASAPLPPDQATSDGEEQYRASFEELTQRIGCDCSYARSR